MNALNLPSETSQDIWTVDPSLYGPSWDVASLPASLTITGDFGGTTRIVNTYILDTRIHNLLITYICKM